MATVMFWASDPKPQGPQGLKQDYGVPREPQNDITEQS